MKISPLYTYNKNETKSKQIQQARIIWTVVHLQPLTRTINKNWVTSTHSKFVDQQECNVFPKAKSCIITKDPFIYNIIYNTKQKKNKTKTTQKKETNAKIGTHAATATRPHWLSIYSKTLKLEDYYPQKMWYIQKNSVIITKNTVFEARLYYNKTLKYTNELL